MKNVFLFSALLMLSATAVFAQTQKPAAEKPSYTFKPAKSAAEAKADELKPKAIQAQTSEEEVGAAQQRVVRRVGVVSNVPTTGTKMGGTKNPEYNPQLRDANNRNNSPQKENK